VDPTARHLLITTNTGDTFYLPISPGNSAVQSRRPRPLRIRQPVLAVGWSPVYGTSPDASGDGQGNGNTGKGDAITPPPTDVLLGTANGQILSLPLPPQDDIFKSVAIGTSKSVEKDLQLVYTLPDNQPVTGIAFGFWPRESSGKARKEKRAWVVMTTKARMYEVQGNVTTTVAGGKGGGWAEEVFKPMRDGAPSQSQRQCLTYQVGADGQNSKNYREIHLTQNYVCISLRQRPKTPLRYLLHLHSRG
jgi:hypothetical protein